MKSVLWISVLAALFLTGCVAGPNNTAGPAVALGWIGIPRNEIHVYNWTGKHMKLIADGEVVVEKIEPWGVHTVKIRAARVSVVAEMYRYGSTKESYTKERNQVAKRIFVFPADRDYKANWFVDGNGNWSEYY